MSEILQTFVVKDGDGNIIATLTPISTGTKYTSVPPYTVELAQEGIGGGGGPLEPA